MLEIEHTIDLNDNWYFYKGDLGGIWESIRPVKSGTPEDSVQWKEVSLPHCFNGTDSVDPQIPYYQGYGWYRKDIKPENPFSKGRTILYFEGAGQVSEVYINSQKAAYHRGGYDEWSVDITDFLINENPLRVSIRCSNSRDLQIIPSDLSDFNLYGGLYRSVKLIYQPENYIKSLSLTPRVINQGETAELTLEAEINHTNDMMDILLEIRNPYGRCLLSEPLKSQNGKIQIKTIIEKPELWFPESPQLYSCTLSIKLEGETKSQSYKDLFGFRYFNFEKHGPFFLNGKRLLLKGTHRHEDHAGIAAAMSDYLIEKEMKMIKAMGANFIRLGHYQQSRKVLDLCDSLGLLVWEEIPWCRGGLGGAEYQKMGLEMLENMIKQHYNHPSVILWGLGNENDWPGDFSEFDKKKIQNYMTQLHKRAHELDDTRLTSIRRCDFCKEIPDVYSPSIWAGWYRGHYREYKKATLEHIKEVDHFLHVEWGASSHAGRFSEDPYEGLENLKTGVGTDERGNDASLYGGIARVSKDGSWSENYACDLFDWTLKEQETMPELSGTAFWPFKDFATPLRPENPVPYVNQKGVVERDLTAKEAFFVVQSYWSNEPMIRIFGQKWTDRWGKEGDLKDFRVYSNCRVVELFLDGQSLGIKKRDPQDFPAAGLRWKQSLTIGKHTLRAVSLDDKVEDSLFFHYHSDDWGSPSNIHCSQLKKEGQEVDVRIQVLDENGKLCLNYEKYVTFSLAGKGQLLDNLGTSQGSSRVQMCNGKSGIKIQSEENSSVLAVTCDNLPTLFIKI